jgi:hypothetical protein
MDYSRPFTVRLWRAFLCVETRASSVCGCLVTDSRRLNNQAGQALQLVQAPSWCGLFAIGLAEWNTTNPRIASLERVQAFALDACRFADLVTGKAAIAHHAVNVNPAYSHLKRRLVDGKVRDYRLGFHVAYTFTFYVDARCKLLTC